MLLTNLKSYVIFGFWAGVCLYGVKHREVSQQLCKTTQKSRWYYKICNQAEVYIKRS